MRKAALVVGGSGGIGGACVRRVAEAYSTVLTVSRGSPREEVLAIKNVRWVSADIASQEGRATTVKLAASDAPLGAVVIASGIPHRASIEDHTEKDWDRILMANLVGPAQLLTALVREVTWIAPASIVLIGSLSARRALPDRSIYGASKAALEHFARCIAIELAPRGISVNTISVGVTDTPFLDGDRPRLVRYAAERIPVGRMVAAEEVADAVLYALASTGALTGATIELDGGAGVVG